MKRQRAAEPEERPAETPDGNGGAAPAAGVTRLRDAFDGRIMAIGLVAAFAFAVDSAHPAKTDLVLQPAWFLALYGALPFCVAVLVEGAGRWRAAVPAACGAFLVAVFVATRAWVAPAGFFEKQPWTAAALVTTGLAFAVAGAVAGRLDLSRWGIGAGDWRWWAPLTGFLLLVSAPVVFAAAHLSPELMSYYPEYGPARHDARALLFAQLGTGVYMLAWEYFFRGFLTFAIAARAGAPVAVLLQALPFLVLHTEKPELELFASYGGSILVAACCLRARTFLPAFILHWGVNAMMEVTAYLNAN